jgi:uncharacterized protein (DUF58 family)
MGLRLTAAGWAVAGFAGVLIVGAAALDYPEMVACGLSAAASIVLALGWVLVRPALHATRMVAPARVVRGTPIICEVTLSNTGRRASREVEVIETVAGVQRRFVLDALPGNASTQVHTYPLPTGERGVLELPPPALHILDPARLVRRRFATEGTTTCYVHPRHYPLPSFGAGHRRDVDGMASMPRTGGVTFYTLRDYVPGDDSRLIHWPSTARAGTLMVRRNSVPDAPGYLVVLDTTSEPYNDASFEEAVAVAASLCVAAVGQGMRLRLRTTADTAPATADPRAAATAALDFLAGVRRDAHDVWWPAMLAADDDVSGVAVVTGQADRARLAAITRAGAVDTSVIVICLDPDAETARSVPGSPVITVPNAEEFARGRNGGH